MKPLKQGSKVTIPKFAARTNAGIVGTCRARAYSKIAGDSIPDGTYRALPNGHRRGGSGSKMKAPHGGGWSGAAVRALRVALVLE